MIKKRNNSIREAAKRPETKERHKKANKEINSRPEVKKAKSIYMSQQMHGEHGNRLREAAHTPESTEKMRQKLKKIRLGENNPCWRGGVSFLPYCEKFNHNLRERVRARFKYECVLCHKTQAENGKALTIHHVDYDKDACCNTHDALFVTLCKNCHPKTNGSDDRRLQWELFFRYYITLGYNNKCYYTKEEMTDLMAGHPK